MIHGSSLTLYWDFFGLLIVMTVWMIWQQSRQQKARRDLQSQLRSGDKIVTAGGMIGTIRQVKDDRLTVEIADGVRVQILKSAVERKYEPEHS